MSLTDKVSQYGVLIMGLLLGGGFAFGGIASYSGLVGGGSGSSGQTELNASLPAETFMDGSYGMTVREQRVTAARNNVVFVTGVYSSPGEKQQLRQLLSGTPSKFDSRVYVQLVNLSESSSVVSRFGITGSPRAVVVGGGRGRGAVKILEDVSASSLESAICGAFRTIEGIEATCL